MKWQRKDTQTIMSGMVVRYRPILRHSSFEVSASRDGICVQGGQCGMTGGDMTTLRSVLTAAEYQYNRLCNNKPLVPFEDDPHCVVQLMDSAVMGEDKVIQSRDIE